jgi:hypothetical protein
MNIVFFPKTYSECAPNLMGHLLVEHSNKWITFVDVLELLQAGEAVEIRQASAAELKRAHMLVELDEASQMLGEKLRELLDQVSPEEADRKILALADALSAIGVPSPLVAPV